MSEALPSKAALLDEIRAGWDAFQAYLATLSEAQLTVPTDAAGWTAKDHIAHLAVWEDSITGMFAHELRWQRVGIDEATWHSGDYDAQNAVSREQHKDKSLAEVLSFFQRMHDQLMSTLVALPEDALFQPYAAYQSDSTDTTRAINYVLGDTSEHYAEHQPWIAAIVAGFKGE